MLLRQSIWKTQADLLAADAAYLGAVLALKVYLVAAPFTPSRNLNLIAEVTLATFTGSAAKTAGAAPQGVYTDPATGKLCLQVNEPAGGWTWTCTVAPASPETIYGYVVTDNAGAVILGSATLPTPLAISAVGQAIVLPFIRTEFDQSSPS